MTPFAIICSIVIVLLISDNIRILRLYNNLKIKGVAPPPESDSNSDPNEDPNDDPNYDPNYDPNDSDPGLNLVYGSKKAAAKRKSAAKRAAVARRAAREAAHREASQREAAERHHHSSPFGGKPFVLALYFSPMCGHCLRLKPAWNLVVERYRDETLIKTDSFDCSDSNDPTSTQMCSDETLRGYPTIRLFGNGQMIEYNGDRTPEDICNFVAQKTGHSELQMDPIGSAADAANKAPAAKSAPAKIPETIPEKIPVEKTPEPAVEQFTGGSKNQPSPYELGAASGAALGAAAAGAFGGNLDSQPGWGRLI